MKTQWMRLSLAAGCVAALMLDGCGLPPRQSASQSSKDESAIDLVRSQRYADAPGAKDAVGKFFLAFAPPKVLPTYREDSLAWCARSSSPGSAQESVDQVRQDLSILCARKGGDYDGYYCKDPSPLAEEVIFRARVMASGRCDVLPRIVSSVIEPTGDRRDPAYIERLRKAGYQTAEDLAAQAIRQTARQREDRVRLQREAADVERVLAQKAAELPRLRKRGAQVCHQERGFTYVGFVEDFTDEKLRVLLSRAYLTSAPSVAPGDFRQEVLWVHPSDWYVCP